LSKITREGLKEMILFELDRAVSSQDGPLSLQGDFSVSKFDNDARIILGSLKNLDDLARDAEGLDPKDLQFLKDTILDDIQRRLNFITSTIDARLGGNRGYKS